MGFPIDLPSGKGMTIKYKGLRVVEARRPNMKSKLRYNPTAK